MKRIIGTGMLGGLAFAALSLASHRNADACNGEPPEPPEPCAFDYDEETQELVYVEPVVSQETTQDPSDPDCGCGQTLELSDDAEVVGAGFVGPTGTVTNEFCDTVLSEETRTAFATAFRGVNWSASAFSGVSKAGIVGGAAGWAWFRIANISSDGFPKQLALGKIDVVNGVASVDAKHNLKKAIDKTACTDCSKNPNSPACTIVSVIDDDGNDDDPPSPTAATSPARVCVNQAATELIARERGERVDGGGCNVSTGGASAAAGFLAVLGAVFAFGRV
ncbi:MAG TPA: hypothetical protein VIU61_07980, partial [Kofleriaceae bacterium]